MNRKLRKSFWLSLSAPAWLRSLRVRLQLWYGALLIAVIGAFGGLLYFRAAAEKMTQIDSQLEAAALVLDAELRGFPPFELGHLPGDGKEKRFRPPPGKKKRDDFLATLELPREFADRGGYFAVWQSDGHLVKAGGFGDEVHPATNLAAARLGAKPIVLSRGAYREAWMAGPLGTRIVTGRSVAGDFDQLHSFGLNLLGFGVATAVFGIVGGWLIANRMVRPIQAMSAAAAAISGDNLTERINAARIETELAGLAEVLNAMFSRLEEAFNRQQQFTADASHELRTPLAIIRSQVELALSKARTPEEYRQTLETCLRAAQRMSNLAQALLTLARADAGKAFSWQNVSLHELVAESLSQLRPLAQARQITLTAELSPLVIAGNAERLGQVVLNLVSNAIAFNRNAGAVEVRLFADHSHAVLTVRDNGPGIAERDCPQIFQRFFRVDQSRSRGAGGTGLGLAICKSLVEAHHGTIDFQTQEGAGTTFRVRIPRERNSTSIKRM